MRCVAAVVLLAAAVQAQGLVDWLPDDVLFHVGTRDLGRLEARAQKGPLGALWSDPALRPLTRRIEARFAPARAGDVGALDLLALVDGEVLLAGVAEGDGLATLGLIDCGPRTLPFRSLLDLFHAQQARGRRIVETTERCEGQTLYVRRRGKDVQAHAWLGNVVCFSDSVPALRGLIARRREHSAAPAAGADLHAYVDPAFWLRRWGIDGTAAEALGLDCLRRIVGEMTLLEDGVRTQVRAEMAGPPRGIVRLLRPGKADLGPVPFLPRDTGATLTVSVDWVELARLVRARRPDVKGQVSLLRRVGLDLMGVVRALGDRLTIAFLPPAWARSAGSETVRDPTAPWGDLVVLQEIGRPEVVARFLERIDALAGPLPGADYHGVRIRVLPGERLGVVALLDDHLVLATRLDAVQAVIRAHRRGPSGLRRSAAYRRASARVPRERSLFTFIDPHARSGPSLAWTVLRQGLGGHDLGSVMDAFEKYRDVSSFAVSRREDGLVLTWFMGIRRPP
ncbi:MAG: hypothetical protein ACYS0K_07285 [Planctomycetota bacterium]|jgi:hypothetical protein